MPTLGLLNHIIISPNNINENSTPFEEFDLSSLNLSKSSNTKSQKQNDSRFEYSTGASRFKVLDSNKEGIEIEFSISELIIDDVKAPTGESYQKLSISGGGHLADIGHPELPTKGIYLSVPIKAELELQINKSTFREEYGYNVYPHQPFEIENDNSEIAFEKNLTAYQINSFYPSKIVSIMDVGIVRAHRSVLLIVCPVSYNPSQQKIRIYSNIGLKINYVNKESSDLDSNQNQEFGGKYDSSSFQSLFENLYLNYEKPTKSSDNNINDNDGDLDGIGADYLIITPEQFCDNLIPLVNSKENQGLSTKVANFTETGSTLSEIEVYIQNAYDTWDIPPSYLLLVGDSNLLPTKYVQHYSEGTLPTDLYYATVDGDDFFPDLLYGRLPVRTDAELDIVIDKNLNWVNNYNPADPWRQRVLLSAYYQTGRYFVDTSESIRSHLESKGYTCNTVYAPEGSPRPEDTTAIINHINTGTFFVNHRDHGIADGWQRPEFYTSHVSSLTNENNYPVIFSVDCQTGHFDETTDSLAEAILKAENKGAVAFIGSTRGSWSGFNDELNRGFITSIWPDYFADYTNNAGHSAELGTVLNFGKFFMFDKYVLTGGIGSEGTGYPWGSYLYPIKTKNTFEMFHLFGDPHLSIIESDIPSEPYNPTPSNESTGINTNVVLSVDVFDPNGDLMDISFYNASDDSLIGIDINVRNRRTAYSSWSDLSRDTTYSWYANVTDGTYTIQSPVWEFTTRGDTEFSTSPIVINEVCTYDDYVELYNYGPDQDMTGWYLELYDGTGYMPYYLFPDGWIFHSNYVVIIEESTGTNTDTILFTGENIVWMDRSMAVGLFNKEFKNKDWFQTSDYTITHFGGIEWEQDIAMTLSNEFAYRINDIDTNKASDWAKDSSGSMGLLNPGQTGVWNAPNLPNNPSPIDGAIDVSTNPTLSVDVSDPDGDPMDVSFYNASDNTLIGIDHNVLSGERASVSWSGLSEETIYSWYAVANDGCYFSYSSIWSFTAVRCSPNVPTNPYPPDGAIGLPNNPTLSVDVSDPDGDTMDVSFYDASDDSLIGTDMGVPNGGTASVSWSGLSEDKIYQWYVNVTDGLYTTQSPIWTFTVGLEAYLHDLSITSDNITFSNPNPEVEETVMINATVYNIGEILGWWNTDWNYRRPIIIDNTANDQTLTNYLKVLKISYDDDMASNFDDLRFVDSDMNELQYWIESYVPAKSADIWINISFIPAMGKTMIYMYYGNPIANSKSEFPFKFYSNPALGGGYDSFDCTRNLWEKPGTDNMYAFYQPSGNAASYYWDGSTWIRDDSAVSGMPFQYALQKRYYYYDEEFGETMFITSWLSGVYQNHVKTWDGSSWVTNATLENGLNLPQGTSSAGGRYLDYIIFKQYGMKHLICPGYNKWTWTGSQWVENASVPDFTFTGDIVILHYKFTQSGTPKYHWFPVVINFHNTTHCKVFHFDGTQWNEIYLGKLGELPGIASTTYFRPDTNVIDNRLTMSLSTSAVSTQFWSSNLYFADIEPTYQIGLEENTIITANVTFFDGNPDTGGIMIGRKTININIYGDQSTTASINWMFTTIGLHDIYVRIENVIPLDINLSNNLAFKIIDIKNMPPPTWDQMPTDQTIELGNSFNFEVNASHPSGIAYYWINDTINFTIDGNGLITNAIALSVGIYWLEVRAYDPYGYYCSAIFKVIVQDTTPPSWDVEPFDQIVELGDDLSYDVDASDLSGIAYYWINDTINFTIDGNGLITNVIALSVGIYWLEVRAYDPYGYYCSAIFKVIVQDTTPPSWDVEPFDQIVELGDDLSYDVDASDLSGIAYYWINDTINFTINGNGLIINTVAFSVGVYWLEVRAYDPYGYYCSAIFKVIVQDTTPPSWDVEPFDQIVELGDDHSYDVDASDPSGIAYYWINDTINFTIDGNGLITNAIALSVGIYWLEVRAYDPYGYYCSAIFKVIVQDTTPPSWDVEPFDQIVELGDDLSYDVDASDPSGIAYYWINNTINFTIDGNGLIINTVTFSVGVYWLEVRAYDPFGYYCSSTIKITVKDEYKPPIDGGSGGGGGGGGGGDKEEEIIGYDLFVILGTIFAISIIMIYKRLKH